ncbi:MAG: histidine phosphatase family protein [Thermoplasmatota archaeon]
MPGRRVFLVRHAQTDLNVAKVVQGPRVDAPLSSAGRLQAQALGRRFVPEPLGAVFTSPMLRARDTASAIAMPHGITPQILAGLTEFDWGIYCGQHEAGATEAAMKAVFERWWAGDFDARPPEGESAREASLRVRAAFETALAAAGDLPPDESIVLVSHGRILKILLSDLLEHDLSKQEVRAQHNTGVTLLEADANEWHHRFGNDTSHRIGVDIRPGQITTERNA